MTLYNALNGHSAGVGCQHELFGWRMMGKKYQIEPQFEQSIPDDEDHTRSVCVSCGFVDYQNPKIVVGSVAPWEGKFLLCRRAVESRKGYWTLRHYHDGMGKNNFPPFSNPIDGL